LIEGFSGQDEDHVAAQPQRLLISPAHFLAIIEQGLCVTVRSSLESKVTVMPVTKAIATLASVAAAACGLFAFSWVGLALLGF
jgi:hypothetical protein